MTASPQFSRIPDSAVKNDIPVKKINWLKGKLSWRVILSVFATIVIVQGVILYCTVQNYKQGQLKELGEVGRSTLAPLLGPISEDGHIHLSKEYLQRLMKKTPVRGVAFYKPGIIYANDLYGEPPMLVPNSLRPNTTLSRLTPEDSRYEISFGPKTMQTDYVVVIRLDSVNIQKRVMEYIRQTTLVAILLSAFVTSVLILVLGKWMIEPILILRHNLLGVARDPSSPTSYLTHYTRRDELGSVISSANKLIKQNADHLSRISQQAQDKIYKVAFFDALTELPNRVHFLKKLDEILQGDERHRYPKLGVLVVDIDHFGDVNNTLGYEAGDKLLSIVAEKLKTVLPDAILIARLSEDEFAAIVNLPYEPENEINKYVDSVLKIFDETFVIQQNDLVLEGSAGMALWPDDSDTAAGLLKKAETALDQAKLEQDGHFRLYSPSFDLAVQNRIQMINDLRFAIEEKQFSLVYQPQISAKNGQIIGAEALLRWERNDENGKPIFTGPDKFIPVAEQSGLIVPIGRWVIEEACRFAKECQDQGIPPFRIAVNLSGIQFHRDDVISLTRDVLARTGLTPHLLELEVTESAVMKDIEQTINLLQQLKNLGVELAIDDFGTGYSSLSYLKRFPVHRLKIDRSFVINTTLNPDEAVITKTIINLGHAIGLHVIAEGVETIEQVNFLTESGCDEFQGYYFSKPLKPADFKAFTKTYKPAA